MAEFSLVVLVRCKNWALDGKGFSGLEMAGSAPYRTWPDLNSNVQHDYSGMMKYFNWSVVS